jgi:hypothetical protein
MLRQIEAFGVFSYFEPGRMEASACSKGEHEELSGEMLWSVRQVCLAG